MLRLNPRESYIGGKKVDNRLHVSFKIYSYCVSEKYGPIISYADIAAQRQKEVYIGVPQGGTRSSVLFLIFMG